MGETLKSAATNLPGSLGQLAVDVTAPVHSPVQTVKGLYALASGLVQKIMPGEQGNEQAVDAMGNFLKERYGSMEAIKKTLAEDPAGLLTDAAGVLSGGAGMALKAGRLGKVAGVTQKVARAVDPIRLGAKPLAQRREALGKWLLKFWA